MEMHAGGGVGGEMTDAPRFGGKRGPDEEPFLASTTIGSHEFLWNKIS